VRGVFLLTPFLFPLSNRVREGEQLEKEYSHIALLSFTKRREGDE